MASADAVADLEEPSFPVLTFPAVRGIGIDGQAFVALADRDQFQEIVGAHGSGAGVDLVSERLAVRIGMSADLGCLRHEALLAFHDKVVIVATPEAPWVSGGDLPAEGDSPEHRDDLDAELGTEIE